MALSTENLDSGADRPREARTDILAAINALNNIYAPDTGGLSPSAVLNAIEGQISESHLTTTLGTAVSLITADENTVGSIAQQVKAEADARALSVAAEAAARTAALTTEATTRTAAIAAAVTQSATAVAAEAAARAAAIDAEAATRAQAVLAEATARGTAITEVTTLVTDGDAQLAESIDTLTATVTGNHTIALAAVETEASTRVDAVSAVAGTVNTLASQMRGSYVGSDIGLVTTGLMFEERQARTTATTALSQRIDSIQAAVAGQQIDATVAWQFDSSVDNWIGNGAPTASGGFLVPASHATDPYVVSPLVEVPATVNRLVQARIMRVGAPVWAGQIRWARSGDAGWDDSRMTVAPEPTWDGNSIGYLSLYVDSADWSGVINQLRFDLSTFQSVATGYRIDWVAVGRPGPGASTASLTAESVAQASALSAEVAKRETLSAALTGVTDPSGKSLTSLTSGIVYEEREARVTADSTEVSQRQALSAKLTGANNPASLTLATLASGLIFDERTARVTGDNAEVTKREALSTKLTGAADPSSLTLSTISSGLIFDERQARSTAVSTEVAKREALSAVLTGVNDPDGKTLATLSSGLIFEERQARATAVTAVASSVSTLTASIANVRRWSGKATGVTNTNIVALAMADGATLFQNPSSLYGGITTGAPISYVVEARLRGTTAAISAAAMFTSSWTGSVWSWALTPLHESHTTGAGIKLMLNAGAPAVALYTSTTAYDVDYQVELRLTNYTPEASIVAEATARVAQDNAEVAKREALSTKMTGLADPVGATLASVSSGLVYEEREARSTAVSSEVVKREALSTKVTGVADPTTATLASLSSGLLFEERQARTTADTSQVQRISQLEASSTLIGAASSFSEFWDGAAPLTGWTFGGTGEYVVNTSVDSLSGGSVLKLGNNAGNDRVNATSNKRLPIDPDRLYKLTYRVRRLNGTGTFYGGLVAFGSDQVTPISTAGTNSWDSYYYGPSNAAPAASWTTYVFYYKLGATYGGSGTLASPYTFRAESRYVSPSFRANYSASAGIMEIDAVSVDILAAEVVAHETSISTLNTTVGDSVKGNTALATRATALEATVNNATTGVSAQSTAIDALKLTVNDSTKGNTALATRTTAIESTVNNATTGLAATRATILTDYSTTVGMNTAIATAVNTVAARLNSGGDTYSSIVTAKTTADTAKDTATTAASNVATVQSWIQNRGSNLVQNSSFELKRSQYDTYPYPAGWGSWGSNAAISHTTGRSGGYSFSNTATAAVTGDHGISTVVSSPSPMASSGVLGGWKPNTTYVVSFWARRTNGAAFTTAKLSWVTAPSVTTAILNPILQTSWQRYAFRITWGASVQANGHLYIGRNGTSATGDVFVVDDVMVTEGDQLEAYSPGLGDGVGQVASVETEASTRASETGHLGAQWSVRMTAGNVIGGVALTGTSSGTAGSTLDFGVRANTFYIAPPAGTSGVASSYPFTVYTTETTLANGIVVQPGVYMKSAVIEYVNATQVDTRGLSIKDANGNILLSAGTPLNFSNVGGTTKPANNATVGAQAGVNLLDSAGSSLSDAHVLNSQVGGVNLVYGLPETSTVAAGNYGFTLFTLKAGTNNPYALQPGEKLTLSAEQWIDAAAVTAGQSARLYLYTTLSSGAWTQSISLVETSTTPYARSWTLTLPTTETDMHNVYVGFYHGVNTSPWPGTVNARKIQVERGSVATLYAPGTNPAATAGATWGTNITGAPYSQIYSNDDSVALGFNPTFDWPSGSYPTNWGNWSGAAPIKETTLVRVGQAAVKYVAAGANVGMIRDLRFASTPMPAGTFLSGSVDLQLVARTGTTGLPLVMVDLYTSADYTTNTRIEVSPTSDVLGVWQRVPWTARTGATQRIYGIRIYVMGAWIGANGGAFTGTVIFDNLRFMLADASLDNKTITLASDGTLSGAGGGAVTISGMGLRQFRVGSAGGSSSGRPTDFSYGLRDIDNNVNYHTGARSYSLSVLDRATGNLINAFNYDVYGGQIGGYFPGNLLTYSEDFSNAQWLSDTPAVTRTLTAGVTLENGATGSVYKITEATTSSPQSLYQAHVLSASAYRGVYFDVKPAGSNFARLSIGTAGLANGVSAVFDIANGTITTAAAAIGTATAPGASITALGNGWYRCFIGCTFAAAATVYPAVYIRKTNSTASYAGTSGQGIYVRRAQLSNHTVPKTYRVTTTSARYLAAQELAEDLNAATPDQLVVLTAADEPKNNRLTSGLDAAIYRCGGSPTVFGSAAFKARAAYVLIGIPGCGQGNGYESYAGDIDNDPNSWIMSSFTLQNGLLNVSGQGSNPRALIDYGYTGDSNATNGAPTGTYVGGALAETVLSPVNKINTGNVSTYIVAGAIDNAYIGNFIQSKDFDGVISADGVMTNLGTKGWAIAKGDGTSGSSKMVIDAADIRGKLTTSQLQVGAVGSTVEVNDTMGAVVNLDSSLSPVSVSSISTTVGTGPVAGVLIAGSVYINVWLPGSTVAAVAVSVATSLDDTAYGAPSLSFYAAAQPTFVSIGQSGITGRRASFAIPVNGAFSRAGTGATGYLYLKVALKVSAYNSAGNNLNTIDIGTNPDRAAVTIQSRASLLVNRV